MAKKRRFSQGAGLLRAIPETPISEQLHPRSKDWDSLSTPDLLRLIWEEDMEGMRKIPLILPYLAQAVDIYAETLRSGGRVIYVGAGTSGRLATADAAELPPTFGISPKKVLAILAGGSKAFSRAIEEAEDNMQTAEKKVHSLGITKRDLVIGLSASGSTRFVYAFLREARKNGARTISIVHQRPCLMEKVSDLLIYIPTGPELLAGSTRMKAGLVQKEILTALSTAAMIRSDRVFSHFMIDVQAKNEKLRSRAIRILRHFLPESEAQLKELLRRARLSPKIALVMGKKQLSYSRAKKFLREHENSLRKVFTEL